MVGIIPGAITCGVYVCIWLLADGMLLLVYYEPYGLAAWMGVGALMGVSVGAIVGWISGVPVAGEELWFGEASQLAPWLVVLTGAVSGAIAALLIMAAIQVRMEGELDTLSLVQAAGGGVVVGPVVALCVRLVLRLKPQ
jgi:hypothetical protein